MNPPLNKSQLRKELLRQRRSLSPEVWKAKSDRLVEYLKFLPLLMKAKTVLAYFSFSQEPDLSSLFITNRCWGFSRCVEQSLIWHYWQPGDPVIKGTYGLIEPHPDLPIINPQDVDLILVPAVACDFQGYRLGYGGGFYDRMLSSPQWASVRTMGIVFDEGFLAELPIDPWDKRLDGVCTESTHLFISS